MSRAGGEGPGPASAAERTDGRRPGVAEGPPALRSRRAEQPGGCQRGRRCREREPGSVAGAQAGGICSSADKAVLSICLGDSRARSLAGAGLWKGFTAYA